MATGTISGQFFAKAKPAESFPSDAPTEQSLERRRVLNTQGQTHFPTYAHPIVHPHLPRPFPRETRRGWVSLRVWSCAASEKGRQMFNSAS